jgi:hypothetical protein
MDDKSSKAIEKRLARLEKAVFGSQQRQEVKKPAKGFGGATGGVRFLISKGQFRSKLGLAEVKTALAKNESISSRSLSAGFQSHQTSIRTL